MFAYGLASACLWASVGLPAGFSSRGFVERKFSLRPERPDGLPTPTNMPHSSPAWQRWFPSGPLSIRLTLSILANFPGILSALLAILSVVLVLCPIKTRIFRILHTIRIFPEFCAFVCQLLAQHGVASPKRRGVSRFCLFARLTFVN